MQTNAQYAHIVTWNDYSESTAIEPSSGTQYLFYDLSAYFISWFKTGSPPRTHSDAIYYNHRRQLFKTGSPPRTDDKPLKLLGESKIQNNVEMVAFLTAPATIEIRQGALVEQRDAGAGLAVLQVAAQAGKPLFRILRNGKVVVELESHWGIAGEPEYAEDPLYVGGSSNRRFSSNGDWHQLGSVP